MFKTSLSNKGKESLVIKCTSGKLTGYVYFAQDSAFFRWDTNEGKHVDLYCDKEGNNYNLTWFGKIEDVSTQPIADVLATVRKELLFLEAVINFVKTKDYKDLEEEYNA